MNPLDLILEISLERENASGVECFPGFIHFLFHILYFGDSAGGNFVSRDGHFFGAYILYFINVKPPAVPEVLDSFSEPMSLYLT